jgi:hypothetical protein
MLFFWKIEFGRRFIMRSVLALLLVLFLLVCSCTYIPEEMPEIGFQPRINQFEATPAVINQGEVTYLRWSVSNADSVSIDNGIGNVAMAGIVLVYPSGTIFYTLTARNFAGEATARTQIIVQGGSSAEPITPAVTPPKIVAFNADRLIITPGELVTLSWDVLGATEIILAPIGQVDTKDSITLSPANTTTFVLTATNTVGKSTAGITVIVQPLSPSAPAAEGVITLNAIPGESGSLVRHSGYLDYTKYGSACAGDTSINLPSRVFLSFDISSIPKDVIIEEAILDLSKYTKHGDPTYMRSMWGNMGALEVYHIQYGTFEDLGFEAYTESVKLTANGAFTNYPLSPWAWDVKNSDDGEHVIQNLIQERKPRCQFRIQFFTTTNWDSVSDMLCFDNASLTIKYVTAK